MERDTHQFAAPTRVSAAHTPEACRPGAPVTKWQQLQHNPKHLLKSSQNKQAANKQHREPIACPASAADRDVSAAVQHNPRACN